MFFYRYVTSGTRIEGDRFQHLLLHSLNTEWRTKNRPTVS